jgi:hypothetical protein
MRFFIYGLFNYAFDTQITQHQQLCMKHHLYINIYKTVDGAKF